MTLTRYAFIKANWHAEIVDQALTGFSELIDPAQIDVFDVPGAFEMPLLARGPGRKRSVRRRSLRGLGCGWRDLPPRFRGLRRGGRVDAGSMDSGVPVLSVSLTPHHFQETEHHMAIYRGISSRKAARPPAPH